MLSRPPPSKACRSCFRELLQALVQNSPQPTLRQHLRPRTSSLITPRPTRSVAQRNFSTALASSSSSSSSLPAKSLGRRDPPTTWQPGKRLASTEAAAEEAAKRKDEIYALIDEINQRELELEELLDELDLLEYYHGVLNLDGPELEDVFSHVIGHRSPEALEAKVRLARQQFGDSLPEGYLNDVELQLYTRLYGEPVTEKEEPEGEKDEREPDRLFREDAEGGLEEVEYERIERENDDISVAYDMERGPQEEESIAMTRAREVAEQLGGELMLEQFDEETVPDPTPRFHPLTKEGKFAPEPSTVFLPKDIVTGPISIILSNFSNKHISETAHKVFGGKRLPHSTTTPPPRAQEPQLPIPLEAGQHHMGEMEANAYLAVLYPGIYATTLSILVEVRKRLGTDWIRRLITQEGGPRILDAGGGGAAVLAWREILRAEYEVMNPGHPKSEPIPMGKSTVLTGSDTLRRRASLLLENTTFLPRLPDYVHVRDSATLEDEREPPKRKQYDIIVAPHTLLGIEEDYLRKQHVQNLWSLLSPDGGVLVLFEKGRQRGFEAIAGAREMLLERYISSPGSRDYEDLTQSPGETTVKKDPGMIIAPCTNHEKCPMYTFPGTAKGRRDYCRFEQRYIRPQFLQRIVGAKDRNHEDVEFSYIAVQKGVDLRETKGIVQGQKAADAAFDGYEDLYDALGNPTQPEKEAPAASSSSSADASTTTTASTTSEDTVPFNTLSLPRTILPPMKRRGHVIFDFCTPAGKIERWTVPRSFSRRAYRDARKARWGDLWALGAKTRVPRNLNLGTPKEDESKKERLQRRSASKAAMQEQADENELGEGEVNPADWIVPALTRKKGEKIPSWKKDVDKKRVRQAFKKETTRKMEEQSEI